MSSLYRNDFVLKRLVLDLRYYLIVNVLTEFLTLNVTAMFCPGGLSHRTARTANGVGLFGPITSRCQTKIETFNIEVQAYRDFAFKKLTRLCIIQDRSF